MISIWPLIVTWVCLILSNACMVFILVMNRKVVRLKDQTIEAQAKNMAAKDRELRASKRYCAAVMRFQHNALDMLMARMALRDTSFFPTKSGSIWDAVVEGNQAIMRLEREIQANPEPSFECPVCHAVSFNPNDIEHGYCGACHQFTGKDVAP
jgi:hypothetical protein